MLATIDQSAKSVDRKLKRKRKHQKTEIEKPSQEPELQLPVSKITLPDHISLFQILDYKTHEVLAELSELKALDIPKTDLIDELKENVETLAKNVKGKSKCFNEESKHDGVSWTFYFSNKRWIFAGLFDNLYPQIKIDDLMVLVESILCLIEEDKTFGSKMLRKNLQRILTELVGLLGQDQTVGTQFFRAQDLTNILLAKVEDLVEDTKKSSSKSIEKSKISENRPTLEKINTKIESDPYLRSERSKTMQVLLVCFGLLIAITLFTSLYSFYNNYSSAVYTSYKEEVKIIKKNEPIRKYQSGSFAKKYYVSSKAKSKAKSNSKDRGGSRKMKQNSSKLKKAKKQKHRKLEEKKLFI